MIPTVPNQCPKSLVLNFGKVGRMTIWFLASFLEERKHSPLLLANDVDYLLYFTFFLTCDMPNSANWRHLNNQSLGVFKFYSYGMRNCCKQQISSCGVLGLFITFICFINIPMKILHTLSYQPHICKHIVHYFCLNAGITRLAETRR